MSQDNNHPKIGVGVIIVKENKVLIGKRKNSHGEGTWAFPGGHLEFGETPEQCAKREVLEEVGIKVKNLSRVPYTNDIFELEGKHYVTLYIQCEYASGKVTAMEPDKTESWEWISWEKIPKNVFLPLKNLLKTKYRPFK